MVSQFADMSEAVQTMFCSLCMFNYEHRGSRGLIVWTVDAFHSLALFHKDGQV